ncbi:MAG: SCO family protein [Verrucomicrobiota bacterium]
MRQSSAAFDGAPTAWRNILCCAALIFLCINLAVSPARAALTDQELQAVQFIQYPNRQLPLDTVFTNEAGAQVRLADCFRGTPVLLVPGYFRCRMLCEGVSDGLILSLQGNRKQVGPDFRVVFLSIDPKEQLAESRARKRTFLKRYSRPGSENGCDFLSGSPEAISAVTNAIGFHYRFDPQSGEFAHPAGFVVVRPDGKLSRYFFGVSFSAAELDQALADAARMKQPSKVEQLLLLCFHYNPVQSRYGSLVIYSVRLLGVATLGGLAFLVVRVSRPKQSANSVNLPPTQQP